MSHLRRKRHQNLQKSTLTNPDYSDKTTIVQSESTAQITKPHVYNNHLPAVGTDELERYLRKKNLALAQSQHTTHQGEPHANPAKY